MPGDEKAAALLDQLIRLPFTIYFKPYGGTQRSNRYEENSD